MCETEVEMSECGAGALKCEKDSMRGANAEGDFGAESDFAECEIRKQKLELKANRLGQLVP
jgi:hypothetical protein